MGEKWLYGVGIFHFIIVFPTVIFPGEGEGQGMRSRKLLSGRNVSAIYTVPLYSTGVDS